MSKRVSALHRAWQAIACAVPDFCGERWDKRALMHELEKAIEYFKYIEEGNEDE